jgi:uncharacterized protein with von Willebrand factor type A (vWA) domain
MACEARTQGSFFDSSWIQAASRPHEHVVDSSYLSTFDRDSSAIMTALNYLWLLAEVISPYRVLCFWDTLVTYHVFRDQQNVEFWPMHQLLAIMIACTRYYRPPIWMPPPMSQSWGAGHVTGIMGENEVD